MGGAKGKRTMNEYEFVARYGDTTEEYSLIWNNGDTYGNILDIDGELIARVSIIVGLPADKMLQAVVDAYWNGVDIGRMAGAQEVRNEIKKALGL